MLNPSLRKITGKNRAACLGLQVKPEQTNLVAPNAQTLAWTDANKRSLPITGQGDEMLLELVQE
jgi:hypothetical protein